MFSDIAKTLLVTTDAGQIIECEPRYLLIGHTVAADATAIYYVAAQGDEGTPSRRYEIMRVAR